MSRRPMIPCGTRRSITAHAQCARHDVTSRRDCTGWVRRSGYRAHLALSSNIMSVDYVCFYLLLYLLNCDIYNREVCSARVTIFWLPKTRTLGPETDTHDTRSLLQDALLISIHLKYGSVWIENCYITRHKFR